MVNEINDDYVFISTSDKNDHFLNQIKKFGTHFLTMRKGIFVEDYRKLDVGGTEYMTITRRTKDGIISIELYGKTRDYPHERD